jgi:hypothetical protein
MANIYDSSILIGRNFEIQQIACLLTMEKDNRIINVKAPNGMRKKYITIQAVKYCIQRGYFKNGAYSVDTEDTNNCHTFLNLLYKKMKLNIDNVDDLCSNIDNFDMIILINDCQHILANKKEKPKFERILQELLEKTKRLKLIIVHEGKVEITVNGMPASNCIEIKPL